MSFTFIIIAFIAFNVVPPEAGIFQIVEPGGILANGKPVDKVVEFSKQSDGRWRVAGVPGDPLGTWAFNGKTLSVTPPGNEQKQDDTKPAVYEYDIATVLGIGQDTNWTTVQDIVMKNGAKAALSRQAAQVTVDLAAEPNTIVKKGTFQIRWKEQKEKQKSE